MNKLWGRAGRLARSKRFQAAGNKAGAQLAGDVLHKGVGHEQLAGGLQAGGGVLGIAAGGGVGEVGGFAGLHLQRDGVACGLQGGLQAGGGGGLGQGGIGGAQRLDVFASGDEL